MVQCVTVCCSVLQYVAVFIDGFCEALQCVAVCCSVFLVYHSVWQCVFQCVAVCCSVTGFLAVCCNVLQCVAACCSVLQRVTVLNDASLRD